MSDAQWKLFLIEGTSLFHLQETHEAYVTEEASETAFVTHLIRPAKWLHKKAKEVLGMTYKRCEKKEFDTHSHTSPVTVPKTFRGILLLEGRDLKLWTDAVNSELTGLLIPVLSSHVNVKNVKREPFPSNLYLMQPSKRMIKELNGVVSRPD